MFLWDLVPLLLLIDQLLTLEFLALQDDWFFFVSSEYWRVELVLNRLAFPFPPLILVLMSSKKRSFLSSHSLTSFWSPRSSYRITEPSWSSSTFSRRIGNIQQAKTTALLQTTARWSESLRYPAGRNKTSLSSPSHLLKYKCTTGWGKVSTWDLALLLDW